MSPTQAWLSKKYIGYKLLSNLWFVSAVWLYFYRIFITDQQVGVLDGLAFAIGLLAEVPSGALADKFGRDKTVRLGQILSGGGLLIQAAGNSIFPFFVGQTILMIGVSLVSGADEALFFDSLKFSRNSPAWRKLVTRGSQATLVGMLFATILGGFLHTFNPRLPWVLNGLAFIASALSIWSIKDNRPIKSRKSFVRETREYLVDIKTGFKEFRLPKLWIYVPIILTVQGLYYATGYGLLRMILLGRFGFNPFWGSIVVATSGLITIWVLSFMHRNADNLSERKILTIISLSSAAALLLSLANIGTWGYIVILVLFVGEYILLPFMSETINYHTSEKQRATVLSVASFLRTLPYVALAPVIGYLSTNNKMPYFMVIWASLIIVATLLYRVNKRTDAKIKLEAEA